MYIDKKNLKKETAIRFERLTKKAFKIVKECFGIDESEQIYFYATQLDAYGGTFSLIPLKYELIEEDGAIVKYLFGDERKKSIFYAYSEGYETFVEIDINHLENDKDESIVDTLIHEILHHLTNEEEEEHGMRWCDLAKYVSENSMYKIL